MSSKPADPLISIVKSFKGTTTTDVLLSKVLDQVHCGEWKTQVEAIRDTYRDIGKPAADELKRKLPGVMFSGRFSKRKGEHLIAHSGLLCLDLDALGEKLHAIRTEIQRDPHILASFISPTGSGLKLLMRIPADGERHQAAFDAAKTYFIDHYEIDVDRRCRDLARLCFVSYDPDLYLNQDAVQIEERMSHRRRRQHRLHRPHKTIQAIKKDNKTPAPPIHANAKRTFLPHKHSPMTVEDVIRQTQPKRHGERHFRVFDLARGLRFDAGLEDSPMAEYKAFVRQWHAMALPNIGTKDFSETWTDFVHALPRAQTPLSYKPVLQAWNAVETEPLPDICEQYDSEVVQRLMALCYHLRGGDGTFYLSSHQAGELLGIDPRQVLRYMKMFEADSILTEVKKGNRALATTYRWETA